MVHVTPHLASRTATRTTRLRPLKPANRPCPKEVVGKGQRESDPLLGSDSSPTRTGSAPVVGDGHPRRTPVGTTQADKRHTEEDDCRPRHTLGVGKGRETDEGPVGVGVGTPSATRSYGDDRRWHPTPRGRHSAHTERAGRSVGPGLLPGGSEDESEGRGPTALR